MIRKSLFQKQNLQPLDHVSNFSYIRKNQNIHTEFDQNTSHDEQLSTHEQTSLMMPGGPKPPRNGYKQNSSFINKTVLSTNQKTPEYDIKTLNLTGVHNSKMQMNDSIINGTEKSLM